MKLKLFSAAAVAAGLVFGLAGLASEAEARVHVGIGLPGIYVGPGYYGPDYYGPDYYGPEYYGPNYYGPRYYHYRHHCHSYRVWRHGHIVWMRDCRRGY